MPVPHTTLTNPQIGRRHFVLCSHGNLSELHSNAVISYREQTSCDFYIVARFRIQSICVWRIFWSQYRYFDKLQAVGKIRMDIPARTVLYRNSHNPHILAPIQKNHTRSCSNPDLFRLKPPVVPGSVSVNRAFSVNRHIFHSDSRDDSGEHITGISLPCSENVFFVFIFILAGSF